MSAMIDPNIIHPGKDLDFVFPEEGSEMPTSQEILEGITRHRVNPAILGDPLDQARKNTEIEWALQAIAEKLVELEQWSLQPNG